MGDFKVHVLGCASAKPNPVHNPSCTVVDYRSNLFMVDCGEGAQQQFQRMHLKFSRLSHIFLTHLHGDHVLGLPGLTGTLALSNLQETLTIHTTEEGADMLRTIFGYFNRDSTLQVVFDTFNAQKEEVIFENKSLRVKTIPLQHRVPTVGYIF